METVKPGSLLTVNLVFSGLVKCKLLWISGDDATVKVTERKHPNHKFGDTIECPIFRLSSRKGWHKSRTSLGRMHYAGDKLDFLPSCFRDRAGEGVQMTRQERQAIKQYLADSAEYDAARFRISRDGRVSAQKDRNKPEVRSPDIWYFVGYAADILREAGRC